MAACDITGVVLPEVKSYITFGEFLDRNFLCSFHGP